MPENTSPLIDLSEYTGRTVGELLAAFPNDYSEMVYFDTGKPGLLGGANFKYDKNWLVVTVSEYDHLTRFNSDYNWDETAFKKERITSAKWEEGK